MGDYDVLLDDDLKLVRVTARGHLSKPLGYEIITKARMLAAEKGYGILCDVRDAALQVGLGDWFFLPRELDVLQSGATRNVRVAVVIPPEAVEEYRFYEDVTANVGLTFRVFLDEQAAVAWMT